MQWKRIFQSRLFLIPVFLCSGIALYSFLFTAKRIDYNADVKPILNSKCITCHGGVKKKGGFSILFREEAMAPTESGRPAIVPGQPAESEMIRRLHAKDPEERMPYKEDALTEKEIKILTEWIRQGASWGEHWAYQPVRQVTVPVIPRRFFGLLPAANSSWVRNDLDYFILEKLREKDLQPNQEADKRTLLRRVSLDLIGIPAPSRLAKNFLEDDSPEAYPRLVDSLLALPQYGEKWASMWLDLARYADTKGYERDDARSIWKYRDWLIRAFNQDKPYDSFLVEQMAGDLLPGATDEQLIATAFHRNTLTNDEGGTDNEEFRVSAVMDRVNTTWEAVMGTSFACVQCHSHPYDPFRHEDYYRFSAFFNNTRDEDTYADYPLLHEYLGADSLRFERLKAWLREQVKPEDEKPVVEFLRTWQPAVNGLLADSFMNSEIADTKWLTLRKQSAARIRLVPLQGKTRVVIRFISWSDKGRLIARVQSPEGPELFSVRIPSSKGKWTIQEYDVQPAAGIQDIHLIYSNPSLKSKDDNGIMFDWFYFSDPFPGRGRPGYDSALAWYRQLLKTDQVDITPVLLENPASMTRKNYVFERGNWLVKAGEVQPGVPEIFQQVANPEGGSRLEMAKWLTHTENPLTARTMVNRVWEQIFGRALAETVEDLGSQGALPTHPKLLDHLAWTFMHKDQWSVKKLLRSIVLSATYRQDSFTDSVKQLRDPDNRYLSRSPRFRLTAEQIRDQALAVSGLLSAKMNGPGVMPYQPEGIWLSPWNGRTWTRSSGEDQYRRAIYTYWKRSAPYPSMLSFDGVSREICTARRIRTNTPLQALTTLNDSAYVETARFFAFKMIRAVKGNAAESISKGIEWATGHPPTPAQSDVLMNLYRQSLQRFRSNAEATCEVVGFQNEMNTPETAAMIVVANAILNLDEVLTKP